MSADSSTRFKTRIETVYLDPSDKFLTQVVTGITWVNPYSEYSLLGSDSSFGSEHFLKSGTLPLTLHKFIEAVSFAKFFRKTPR